ncbi:MAG: N-acetyltransferase [Betaproteobacteria bacterium]|nr:N-acetyltransferase [Betaproteobacteria bacterium]
MHACRTVRILSASPTIRLRVCVAGAWSCSRPSCWLRPLSASSAIRAVFALSLRYWIRLRHAPSSLIGWVKIDALTAGAFHSGRVGYAIAEAHHRRGYMQEALAAVKRWLFAPRVNLHRLQASVLPENLASLRVLRHCDFEDIGLARSYLWVRGAWRDHVITQCINSAWRDG